MAISTRLSGCVKQVILVNERTLHFRLEHACGFITVVAVWFQRSNSRRLSWYSNTGRVKKDIDRILISTRWRLIQKCLFYRSAEVFCTDHKLVIAILKLHFRCHKARGRRPQLLNLERQQEQACKSAFAIRIWKCFDAL